MHNPEKLKIIGIDEAGPNRFLVATECSGECFDQNYPKQIRHSFKFNKKYLSKHEDGEYHFVKKMREMYSSQDVNISKIDKKSIEKSFDNKIKELNNELTGFEI